MKDDHNYVYSAEFAKGIFENYYLIALQDRRDILADVKAVQEQIDRYKISSAETSEGVNCVLFLTLLNYTLNVSWGDLDAEFRG